MNWDTVLHSLPWVAVCYLAIRLRMLRSLVDGQQRWLNSRCDDQWKALRVLQAFAIETDAKRFQQIQEELNPSDPRFVDCTFTNCTFRTEPVDRDAPTIERKV